MKSTGALELVESMKSTGAHVGNYTSFPYLLLQVSYFSISCFTGSRRHIASNKYIVLVCELVYKRYLSCELVYKRYLFCSAIIASN